MSHESGRIVPEVLSRLCLSFLSLEFLGHTSYKTGALGTVGITVKC